MTRDPRELKWPWVGNVKLASVFFKHNFRRGSANGKKLFKTDKVKQWKQNYFGLLNFMFKFEAGINKDERLFETKIQLNRKKIIGYKRSLLKFYILDLKKSV